MIVPMRAPFQRRHVESFEGLNTSSFKLPEPGHLGRRGLDEPAQPNRTVRRRVQGACKESFLRATTAQRTNKSVKWLIESMILIN